MDKIERQAQIIKDDKVSKPKSKLKKKKVDAQSTLMPRSRLEPRLTPKKKENKDNIIDIEKDKRLVISLDRNEINEYSELFTLEEALSYGKPNMRDINGQISKKSDASNLSAENHVISKAEMDSVQTSSGNIKHKPGYNYKSHHIRGRAVIKRVRKRLRSKGMWWKDREIKALATGLQSLGFADMKKVADFVRTKNENDISVYMKPRCVDATKAKQDSDTPKRRGRPGNRFYTVSEENLKTWPNIRKWRRLAYEQMLLYTRTKDYSKPVISALCKKFYDEEEEPTDPQVINVKLIYKYLMDCMAGQIPAQLPPKESAVVLDILREVRLMPIAFDFEEERKFIQEFRTATTFKPFEVKDEFKKKYKKELVDDTANPSAVPVPEQLFMDLSRHKRLVQSFNPLVIPVWFLQKEQEIIQKYSQETNVYVD